MLTDEEKEQIARAKAYSEKACALDTTNARYAYLLGLLEQALLNEEDAVNAWAKAASLDKKFAEPRIMLAKVYIARGLPDQANVFLQEAYRLIPNSFAVNNNLGAVSAMKKNYQKAADYFRRCIDLTAPDAANAAAGDLSAGRSVSGAANTPDQTARFNLARLYILSGETEKAIPVYEELARLYPDNNAVRLEWAKALIAEENPDAARAVLAGLLYEDGEEPDDAAPDADAGAKKARTIPTETRDEAEKILSTLRSEDNA